MGTIASLLFLVFISLFFQQFRDASANVLGYEQKFDEIIKQLNDILKCCLDRSNCRQYSEQTLQQFCAPLMCRQQQQTRPQVVWQPTMRPNFFFSEQQQRQQQYQRCSICPCMPQQCQYIPTNQCPCYNTMTPSSYCTPTYVTLERFPDNSWKKVSQGGKAIPHGEFPPPEMGEIHGGLTVPTKQPFALSPSGTLGERHSESEMRSLVQQLKDMFYECLHRPTEGTRSPQNGWVTSTTATTISQPPRARRKRNIDPSQMIFNPNGDVGPCLRPSFSGLQVDGPILYEFLLGNQDGSQAMNIPGVNQAQGFQIPQQPPFQFQNSPYEVFYNGQPMPQEYTFGGMEMGPQMQPLPPQYLPYRAPYGVQPGPGIQPGPPYGVQPAPPYAQPGPHYGGNAVTPGLFKMTIAPPTARPSSGTVPSFTLIPTAIAILLSSLLR